MLFKCFACGTVSFNPECNVCSPTEPDTNVPLDPEYYPEFQYRSKGFVKDIFLKKRTEKKLQKTLDTVLEKYKEFEHPYFVNYFHLAGRGAAGVHVSGGYTGLQLFHRVLLQLGFSELVDLPKLTSKLIRSTSFRFEYADFARRITPHIKSDLEASLTSWIEDSGGAFRTDLSMFIYYLWSNKLLDGCVAYNAKAPPLVLRTEWGSILKQCEQIYFLMLTARFRITLEKFDPSRFITMYAVDAMDGFEFEDFLGKLLTAIGYDVEVTKRSGDQGADLFAEKFGKKLVIQAKNYFDSVGNSAVQQVLAAKAFYACDEAMVITNSHFTSAAVKLAESAGVRLVDRDKLQGYLDDYNRVLMGAAAEAIGRSSAASVPSHRPGVRG